MRQVVVHDLAEARAALSAAEAAGEQIELKSARDAAAYAGVGYLLALSEAVGEQLVIDCGDDAGLVMSALRTGCRKLAFSGPDGLFQPLAEMAEQLGAEIRREPAGRSP